MQQYIDRIAAAAPEKTVLGGPRGTCPYKRVVILRKKNGYQAEQYTDKQVFHNNIPEEGLAAALVDYMNLGFAQLDAFAQSGHFMLKQAKSGKILFKAEAPQAVKAQLTHDRKKNYILPEGAVIPPLQDLGVFTAEGKVAAPMRDKYRQINRFLELIDDAVGDRKEKLTVIDFGCGKSYLTFILYYYFTRIKGLEVDMIGLDLKADVIEHCNKVAKRYGYEGLRFELGDIKGYNCQTPPDMVVTLHACDTATDHALYHAVRWGTKMIFSVPCCQHELNPQMKPGTLSALTKYGIIRERTAALMTDAIRGCLLEWCGYKTQLLEFVDLENSPKNILIRAVKSNIPLPKREHAKKEAEALLQQFGFDQTLYNLLTGK